MTEMPAIDTIDATLAWLRERATNCVRMGSTKTGADRAGWIIQDGAYFLHTESLIRRAYRPGERRPANG